MREAERICTPQGAAWFHWLCCYQLDSQQLAQPLGKSGGKQTLTPLSAVSQDPARNAKPQTSDLSENHCIWICILTRSTTQVSSVTQSCPLFVNPWTAACRASLSITNSLSFRKLMSIELVMSSNHLILCRPLLFLPSIFPSIRVFSNEFFPSGGQCIGVAASASVLPMNIQDWFP